MVKRLIRQRWFWFAITGAGVVSLLAAFLKKLLALPPRIVAVQKKPGEKLVVLFGDSITQGAMSSNYVDLLAQRMQGKGYRFMNAGIGGDTAYNLLNRLGPVVESQPDAIVILIGTNDMEAYLRGGHLSPLMERLKKLPQAITMEWSISNVRQIVLTLQNETRAMIALCSIPPLGEDLDSLPNRSIRLFNEAVKALPDELNVFYLPVYETMEEFLRAHQQEPGQAFDESRAGGMMMRAMWDHNIRGRSWDDVSARHGLLLTTDTIHFNDRGGDIIADLIEGWLHVHSAELPVTAQPSPASQKAPIELSQVAPELRKPMQRGIRLSIPIERAWGRRVTHGLLAVLPAAKIEGVTVEQPRTAKSPVRLYRPAIRRSTAALFWIHGGGLVIGRAVQNDQLCALTARELGILVVSVEYRKAPENPFPAALDDCIAGWRWLQREAHRLGVDPARITVGGQSAGGGLAASLVQRIHDSRDVQPVAQWLFCPMLDDRTAARRELDRVGHFVWNNRQNRFGWRSYLGVEPGSDVVPAYAVPSRQEDVRGLPPAWIGVGDIDLFYDEDRAYAERLHEANVEVTFEVVSGAPHGFEAWAPDTTITREYISCAQAWLRQALEGTQG